MGVWEDLSQFLEGRLEEFLDNNPRLKLRVLLENVRQQEEEASDRLRSTQADLERQQEEIVAVARDVQKWQGRIEQARTSGREDLATAARERSDELLRKGNQLWGQMTVLKQQLAQTQSLYDRIREKRRELEALIASQQGEAAEPRRSATASGSSDDLERRFQQWELEQELERLRRRQ